jgi:hypothetical protein
MWRLPIFRSVRGAAEGDARLATLECLFSGRKRMPAIGALRPLAATLPSVSGSLRNVLEIAVISVAVVNIW